jgi:hypothetical protein
MCVCGCIMNGLLLPLHKSSPSTFICPIDQIQERTSCHMVHEKEKAVRRWVMVSTNWSQSKPYRAGRLAMPHKPLSGPTPALLD